MTVRHEFSVGHTQFVAEEQDLVYRSGEKDQAPSASGSSSGVPAEAGSRPGTEDASAHCSPWQFSLTPDPTLLFRFSAVTHNAHRIHYDRPYATEVEGFAGLVVQGPLLALLLLELPRRHAPSRTVAEFVFRARRPVFADSPLHITGMGVDEGAWELTAGTDKEGPAMTATVVLR